MTSLVFDSTGWDTADERFEGVEERVQDARPVWDDVADAMTDNIVGFFDSQGDGSWRPLSRRYARWKARRYPGRPQGVLTGGLRDSVASRGGARYSVRRWDHDEVEVGTENPVAYLAVAQGRPPVGPVTDEQRGEYLELVRRWVLYGEGA